MKELDHRRDMSKTLKGSMEDLAWAIARVAHLGQSYKRAGCNWEYMTHIKRVVHNLGQVSETIKIAGILHDVVEYSDFSLNEIHRIFGVDIAHIVNHLTHMDGEPYGKYIIRCSENSIAKMVKGVDIADHILHCVRPDRVPGWEVSLQKYTEALVILHSIRT